MLKLCSHEAKCIKKVFSMQLLTPILIRSKVDSECFQLSTKYTPKAFGTWKALTKLLHYTATTHGDNRYCHVLGPRPFSSANRFTPSFVVSLPPRLLYRQERERARFPFGGCFFVERGKGSVAPPTFAGSASHFLGEHLNRPRDEMSGVVRRRLARPRPVICCDRCHVY